MVEYKRVLYGNVWNSILWYCMVCYEMVCDGILGHTMAEYGLVWHNM